MEQHILAVRAHRRQQRLRSGGEMGDRGEDGEILSTTFHPPPSQNRSRPILPGNWRGILDLDSSMSYPLSIFVLPCHFHY